MKKMLVFWWSVLLAGTLVAQTDAVIPPSSVATIDNVFAMRLNPAGLVINNGFQFGLVGTLNKGLNERASYYLSAGGDGGASGFAFHKFHDLYRYQYVLSTELTRGGYAGIGIDFGKQMYPEYSLGLTIRPARFVSLGGAIFNMTENNSRDAGYRAGLGIRPFGQWLTLSGDAIFNYNLNSSKYETDWEALLSARIVDGVTLKGFYDLRVDPMDANKTYSTVGISVGINIKHHSVEGASEVSGDDGAYANGIGAYHYTSSSMRSIFSPVKPTKFVLMEFDGPLMEEEPRFSFFGSLIRVRTVTEFTLQLQKYSKRKDLAGIVLYMKNPEGGPAKFEEIRQAIQRFQNSGKKVYVYFDNASNLQYYLASVADRVIMNPSGQVWLTGISTQLMYVKNLFDKLGIKANVVHIGKYKSARDMFTQDSTTSANAEQINAYLDDLYEVLTRDIANSRGMNQDSLKALIDRGPFVAQTALKSGLVDKLMYHDELKKLVEGEGPNKKYRMVTERIYNQMGDWQYTWEPPITDKIALIYAVGSITTGKSRRSPFTGAGSMGSETIASAIRAARKDHQVKAIVLRVDSPGGSALASDIIWREVQLTTTGKHAKPFIVSMGDVAASGGYYIAMGADSILADANTLSGSIGVLAGSFSVKDMFDKIGIHTDTFKRGDRSDFLSATHNMTEDERQKLFDLISDMYGIFVNKAAEGRGLEPDSIDALGRGRIYSGTDAEAVGLVDKVAGLHEALQIAQKAAGIPLDKEVKLDYYPKYELNLLEMIGGTEILAQQLQLSPDTKQILTQLEQLNVLASDDQVYYLLPYLLEISK